MTNPKRTVGIVSILAAAFLVQFSGRAAAHDGISQDAWRWVDFTQDSELGAAEVLSIVEPPDGSVWVATREVLARYDGYRWHRFGVAEGLPETGFRQMESFPSGRLLLTTQDNRLFAGDSLGFERIPVLIDGVDQMVGMAVPAGEDLIFIVPPTQNETPKTQIIRWTPDKTELISTPAEFGAISPRSLWKTDGGTVYLHTVEGLFQWVDGEWVAKLPVGGFFDLRFLEENQAGVGIAAIAHPPEKEGLWEWDAEGTFGLLSNERVRQIEAMAISQRGDAVIAYDRGDAQIRVDGEWSRFHTLHPLGASFSHLRFRSNGDLWVGTWQGLYIYKLSSDRWSHPSEPLEEHRARIHEILLRDDGSIWLATQLGLEIQNRDGSVRWIENILGTDLKIVTGLVEDASGNVWISSGASFDGAFRWDGSEWRHFGREDGLAADNIHKIRIDRSGRLWFLGLDSHYRTRSLSGPGAFVFDGTSFELWGPEQGLVQGRVYDFVESPDGAFWFGTMGGISRYHEGRWTKWTMAEGLRADRVFSLAVDHQGRTWFTHQAARGTGYIEHEQPHYLLMPDGSPGSDTAWDVEVDPRGWVWISTHGGLALFRDGQASLIRREDGLRHLAAWPVVPTEDRVYIGTLGQGLTVLNLDQIDRSPPRVEIAPPRVEGDRSLIRWEAFARWGEMSPSGIDTRFRLDGGSWSPWTREREKDVTDLSPGSHVFELQARGLLGDFDPNPTATTFSAPYPFYRRPAFVLPITVLSISVILLLSTLMTRKKRHAHEIGLSEAQRIDLESQLQESRKTEAVGRLAGGIAHDFNNLLMVINGYSDTLLHRLPKGDSGRVDIQRIHEAGRQAAALTQQLLAISQKQILAPKAIDLNRLLDEMQDETIVPLIGEKIELLVDRASEPAIVQADPTQIKQVVMNLVLNARDAMPRGGKLTIRIRTYPGDNCRPSGQTDSDTKVWENGHIVLAVIDTGTGMDGETKSRLFDPYFTTKPQGASSSQGKGSGLGLSPVHGIVQQSGGYIQVDSEIGQGTCVCVHLPRAEQHEESVGPIVSEPPQSQGRMTVLLVEDQPEVRSVLRRSLEASGYRVSEAREAEEAIELATAQSGPIHLLLTDIVMPGMSGPELAKQLVRGHPKMKVLFLSGYTGEALDQYGGIDEANFLQKPFGPSELAEKIREVLAADGPDLKEYAAKSPTGLD